jgi:outer membrane usher protein
MNSRAAPQIIPLSATLNGRAAGEINAAIENDQLRGMDITPIRAQLEELLPPEEFQKLQTNSTGLMPPELLASAGVRTHFDFQTLTVELVIPIEKRRTQTLSLIGSSGMTAARTITPSDFSAYLNVRGGWDYIESSPVNPVGFTDPQFAFENAFNWRGLVLENEIDLNPAPDKTWEKRDTRLIWDEPEKRLRWTVGDLNYPVTSFQSFLPMAGFSLHRENSLQPYRVTSPLGQSTFFLQSDSKVEIMINGHTVRTVQMSAGPHQISNFPLTGGANNVMLRLTDAFGRVEYIKATLFYDPGLLKAGESEFNYAIGFPSSMDPSSALYRYDIHPAATAFHRWGITDRFTAGFNAVATENTQVGGGEAIVSTVAGTVGLESSFSHDRDIGSGTAQRLQYHYYVPHEGVFADGNLNLGVQYQTRSYTQPQPFGAVRANNDLWDFQARYSQGITDSLSAGAGYTRQFSAGETRLETYYLTAGYHWRRLHTDINLEHNRAAGRNEWRVFLSVMINWGPNHSTYSSYDSSSRISRNEWQYVPSTDIETMSATLGLQNSPAQTELYGNIHYFGRRAEMTLSQDSQINGENRTSLRFGAGLVFADGQFAVSRPIQNSFLLVDSIGSLHQDGGAGLQPQAKRFAGQEDWLGPAVLPQITAYYPTHIVAAPLNPAADFDPQTGDILLKPTYKSGTHLRLGHAATVNVSITLQWADGSPAALQLGTLTAEGGTPVEFVSNREGITYLSEVRPGKYRAALASHPEAEFALAVPATKEREISLGTIKVPTNQ